MTVRKWAILLLLSSLLNGEVSNAATLQVPTDFATLQSAIDSATHGDEIVVATGTYIETIHFQGKNIRLTSTNPRAWAVVEATIIDASEMGSVVTFAGTETEECVLAGFTIRNGSAPVGGGILGNGCEATIDSNLIRDNFAEAYGGGVAHCAGLIIGNRVEGNRTARYRGEGVGIGNYEPNGGGFFQCNGEIVGNLIAQNDSTSGAGLSQCHGWIHGNHIERNTVERFCYESTSIFCPDGKGGGLFDCDGLIEKNLIHRNVAVGYCIVKGRVEYGCPEIRGAGLADCDGTIANNLIGSNSLFGPCGCVRIYYYTNACYCIHPQGAGLDSCNGVLIHNTIVGNRVIGNHGLGSGGGIAECTGTIKNCLFWLNSANKDAQIQNSSPPDHCLIPDWTGGGIANLDFNPSFVDPENGDFRLRNDSPGIDAGALIVSVTEDFDGNPRPFLLRTHPGGDGSGYDIGAFEYHSPSDLNSDQKIDAMDVMIFQTDWGLVTGPGGNGQPDWEKATDLDGDGVINGADLADFLEDTR